MLLTISLAEPARAFTSLAARKRVSLGTTTDDGSFHIFNLLSRSLLFWNFVTEQLARPAFAYLQDEQLSAIQTRGVQGR